MSGRPLLLIALLAAACESGATVNADASLEADAEEFPDAPIAADAPPRPDSRLPADAGIDAPPAPDARGPDAATPSFVRITVDGAVISPSTSDRALWDGFGSISTMDWNDYVAALSASNAYDKTLEVISAVGASGVDKPDPFGTAELFVDDVSQGKKDLVATEEDTYTPTFKSTVFSHVRWTAKMSVVVSLSDEDIALNDTIGTATISAADLTAALAANAAFHVKVASQTNNQLPFVTVTVTAE